MTRDEQIAQLKPGDRLMLASGRPAFYLGTLDGLMLYVHSRTDSPVHACSPSAISHIPPKPKAVPGQMYRKQVFKNGYHYTFGTPDGRIRYLCEPPFDFDPAVWTPIDDVKVGE